MNITKKGIILAILFMTVGFAAITTTLTITGVITIKPNNENFEQNVIFSSATSSQGTATITNNGKSITFTTNEFKQIGDSATINFSISNTSNYKAVLGTTAISCVGTGDNASLFNNYININYSTNLNSATIERNSSISGTLTSSMKKSYTGDAKSVTYTCTISANAAEATN